MKGLKKTMINILIFILIIVALSLYKYQSFQDKFSCEQNTYMRCQNNILKCESVRNINSWHFQQTWFVKPQRGVENFGAVFGNQTGIFYHPGNERDGSYCIDDKTIHFKNDNQNAPLEKIEIISISETEMVLEFEGGEKFKYYNPDHKD